MESPLTTIADLLTKEEELHPELKKHLVLTNIGVALKHPLVYSIFYREQENALLNHSYELKKREVDKAIDAKNWNRVIAFYERPYRFEAFLAIEPYLNPDEAGELLLEIWTDSENIWQNKEDWNRLLVTYKEPIQKALQEECLEILMSLPEQFPVYRGCGTKNKNGLSWTLSREKAQWFAQRYNKNGTIVCGMAKKKDVLFYTDSRGEAEVVIHPSKVFEKNSTQL